MLKSEWWSGLYCVACVTYTDEIFSSLLAVYFLTFHLLLFLLSYLTFTINLKNVTWD